MSLLERVTITGADSETDIDRLIELSKAYPFVEWGILLSAAKEGTPRYPSRDWMRRLANVAADQNIKLAAHVCGRWQREMFDGLTSWYDHVPFEILDVAQRMQINTGAGYRASIAAIRAFPANIGRALDRGFLRNIETLIFQWDGVNSDAPFAVASHGFNVAVLFDKSGGAGRYTAEIPDPHPILPTGFAGGLGPETVLWAICELDVWKKPYWVDMEGNVRTADNRLDIEAVQRVLQVGAECQSPSTASASAIG